MRNVKRSRAALFKTPVGTAIAALIGLIAAASCLLVFALDLLVIVPIDIGALIVSFVVCGVGAAIGLILIRSLVPRREPQSLFAGPGGVFVQPTTRTEIPAQAGECSRYGSEAAIAIPGEADFTRSHDRRQRVSRYKTPVGGGVVGLIALIGMGIALMGFNFPRQFLSLSVPGGGVVALCLYWARRRRQNSSSSII